MRSNSRRFNYSRSVVAAIVFTAMISVVNGQQSASSSQAQGQVATVVNSSAKATVANVPVFTDYRGVKIGMTAEEVRSKLDRLKEGKAQDYLVLSDHESAQIYYDSNGKVTAVSIDYFGDTTKAPAPEAVLGTAIEAKADGSMYQLNRYPQAGYWVSYNRTAGDKPIVSITMQKL